MQEKKRNTARVTVTGPGDDLFGDLGGVPAGPGLATVIHGTYAETLPVAQMSVAQVRGRFADLLDIHPEATAILDGVPVDDDVVLLTVDDPPCPQVPKLLVVQRHHALPFAGILRQSTRRTSNGPPQPMSCLPAMASASSRPVRTSASS